MTRKQFEKERHDMQMGEMFSSHVPTTALGTMTKATADHLRKLSKHAPIATHESKAPTPVEHTSLDLPLAVVGSLTGLILFWIKVGEPLPVLLGAAAGGFAGYYAMPAIVALLKLLWKLVIASSVVAVIYFAFKWFS